MKKSTFLTCAGLVGGGLVAVSQPHATHNNGKKSEKNTTKPNVVVILADDIGYGDFSCNGATRVQTPNIDLLASEGVNFSRAHSVAATSTPSRYSLFTGEYSWRRKGTTIANGDEAMIIKPNRYTLPKMFKEAGYATGAVGKWHLGVGSVKAKQNWNGELDQGPREVGFDYSYIMAATADRVPCVFIENHRVVNLDPADPISVSYTANFAGEPTGASNPELLTKGLKPIYGHDQSIINGISRIGYMKGGKKALWVDENIGDSITKHATDFIETNKDKPFFLYCGTNDAHVPRVPHPRFVGKSLMGPRGDAIAQFDATVGEIVKKLDELNLRENTLIVVTSDNGPILLDGYADRSRELLGTHSPSGPYFGTKYSIYQGGTAVPCIVNWKGTTPAKKSDALISQVDMLNTFAALVGVNTAGKAPADGQNQLEAWLGKTDTGREYVMGNAEDCLTVVTKDWKYIEPSGKAQTASWADNVPLGFVNADQLFAIRTDLKERNNVAAANPAIVNELKAIAQKERALGMWMSLWDLKSEEFILSTPEKPVWFMIHDNRPEMKFFKTTGDKVKLTTDMTEVANKGEDLQFRMQRTPANPDNFYLISKTKGENYVIGRSDADETLTAVVPLASADNNSAWTFLPSNTAGYKQIKSLGEPSVKNGKSRIVLNTRIELNTVHLWITDPADAGNQFAAIMASGNQTGINSVFNHSGEKVWIDNATIKSNVPITVYSISGTKVNHTSNLPSGIYIVRTPTRPVKVMF